MKPNGYRDRALRARDPRFSQIFDKLRYGRRDMVPTVEAGGPAPELLLTPPVTAKPKKPGTKSEGEG